MRKRKDSPRSKSPFLQPALDAAYLGKPAHLQTRKDRYYLGKTLREICTREAHAEFKVDSEKRKDPIELLLESNEGRIGTLLPIRYGRMATSPFAFFRGAAIIMAADLANIPTTGYAVQSCGDSHLCNFGAFATPERNVIFDINDFDETFPAPWEWDLNRLAASFVIAGRHNGHKKADCRASAVRVVEAYRDRLFKLAEMQTLEAWYDSLCYEEIIERTSCRKQKEKNRKELKKAVDRTHLDEFVKLAHIVDGKPRIIDRPPLIYHDARWGTKEFQRDINDAIQQYRATLPVQRRVLFDRYEFVDTAIKVVGVGSVGTMCVIALFFSAENDPLILQVKQARQSVLEPYSGYPPYHSHGERVVVGQRLMQAASDIFLGYFIGASETHYYVRQLRDVKVKMNVETFSPNDMLGFAQNCGWALARAHSRSGDPAIIAGYIGKGSALPEAVAQFAQLYAEQNTRDYQRLLDAISAGTIKTAAG